MELPCEPTRVFVEPRWWRFAKRVIQARRIGNIVLVIFDYMDFPNDRPAQNLVAYDLHQNQLWKAENPGNGAADAFVNFISENPLVVWNFACYRCTIDSETGRLIEKQFTK